MGCCVVVGEGVFSLSQEHALVFEVYERGCEWLSRVVVGVFDANIVVSSVSTGTTRRRELSAILHIVPDERDLDR